MVGIIELDGLTKVYSRRGQEPVAAVADLTLSIGAPGIVHGFLGPNGSGKTTTIRCLLGLIEPTSGSARVFGADATHAFAEVAPRVGAIVESPKMFPNFSARRNLSLLADLAGIDHAEVDRVLEVVKLADRAGDNFKTYSLGMKQRLAIAAALLRDPDLLILDEPANGLDPAGIAEMRVLIRSIADQGKAVLVSSHQLAEIELVCDEATIISRGRLIETGTIDDLRRHAGDDEVLVTIVERERAIAALRSAGFEAHPRPAGDELKVDIESHRSSEVTRILADAGLYLSGLRTHQASLEVAFLNLTGDAPPPPLAPAPPAEDVAEEVTP